MQRWSAQQSVLMWSGRDMNSCTYIVGAQNNAQLPDQMRAASNIWPSTGGLLGEDCIAAKAS